MQPVAERPRWRWRLGLRRFATLAVVGLAAVELWLFRDRIGAALGTLDEVDPWWLVVALAASAVSIASLARTQRRMLRAGGARVSMKRMMGLAYTANAINWTFPGGSALSAGYVLKRLRSWDAAASAVSFALIASGALTSLTFVGLAIVLGVVAGSGALASVLGASALAAVALALVIALWRRPDLVLRAAETALGWINTLLRRDASRGRSTLRRFVADIAAIRPRRSDWLVATGFATLKWLADLCCLLACCRALHVDHTTLVVLVTTYLTGMTASSISIVPGGFGVIDVAMVLALTAGGVSSAAAAAGVVLYRLVSCAFLVAVGWLVWAGWRTSQARATAPAPRPVAPPPASVRTTPVAG